ncbi:MAG: hypothetical protein H6662_07195 [Ardenticatenaceae bacterium]|nr:hypothetical protein [Ardenticatenaceae bacterium]MCB9004027.1 hypothetical protein [Ardenticatenaceae bacterium]
MFKKDYIMRMIEQVTAVLTQVLALGNGRQYDEAFLLTSGTLRDLTGLGSAALRQIPAEALLDRLMMQDDLGWVETAVSIATLLHQEGLLHAEKGNELAAYESHQQALQILLTTHQRRPDADWPEMAPTIPSLLSYLDAIILPGETYAQLLRYFEEQGDYGRAEDALFTWRDALPDDGNALELGDDFYHRLLQKSDHDLENGNLPRAEVRAGLADLTAD